MASAEDSFLRADATSLGVNWTDDTFGWGGHSVSTNHADPDSADSFSYYNATTFGSSQYAEIQVNTFGNGPSDGAAAGTRMTLTGGISRGYLGGYAENWLDGDYRRRIIGWNDPTIADIANEAIDISTGDLIRMEVSGTTLNLYINTTLELNATDSSITAGFAGMYGNRVGTRYTSWAAADLGAGPAAGYGRRAIGRGILSGVHT
jgi:hypothetical protein